MEVGTLAYFSSKRSFDFVDNFNPFCVVEYLLNNAKWVEFRIHHGLERNFGSLYIFFFSKRTFVDGF